MSSGASQNISVADAGYQEKKTKTSRTEAVAYCCKVMIGDGYLWQVSVCWDVPSVIEASLLYVKAHGSM